MEKLTQARWKQKGWGLQTNSLVFFCAPVLFLFFLIWVNVRTAAQLGQDFHYHFGDNFSEMQIFITVLCAYGLVLALLYGVSVWLATQEQFETYKWQFLVLAILSLSILPLIINIIYYALLNRNSQNDQHFAVKQWARNFLVNFGIRKWRTIDYALIGVFAAITVVLGYVQENVIPQMPYGGGVNLQYIPLIIFAFLTSFLGGWVLGAVSALIMLAFIPGSHMVSPWSYLLDYFLPLTTPALAGLMKFKVNQDKNYVTYMNYFIMCFIILLIIYFWQVLVGVLVWNVLFPDSIWPSYGSWLYSLIYNFIHVFIFTYPIVQVVVPAALRALAPLYSRRQYYGY